METHQEKHRWKREVYLHLVWATKRRQPLLLPEMERQIYRCIESEVRRLGCTVLAIGGMPDHVHLAVRVTTRHAIASLMKQAKGVSSALANDLNDHATLFRWQEGYSVFSFSRSQRDRVVAYIAGQKQHHAGGTLWTEWEETGEDA